MDEDENSAPVPRCTGLGWCLEWCRGTWDFWNIPAVYERTGVHQGIEKFLIGVNQRIKLCGDGKDHMEVRCVNPDLLENGLAAGAVTVPAGVVVDGDMTAVLTGGDIASHFRGHTEHALTPSSKESLE